MWKYYPWLAALALAPLLYGGVEPGAQVIVGALLGLSWLVLSPEIARRNPPVVPFALACFILVLGLFYIVPLPSGLVELLSPERFRVARHFAIDPEPARWVFLSSSVTGSIQRYWELALVVAAFQIMRRAVKQPGIPSMLAGTLTVTLLLLAASEGWRRLTGATVWGSNTGPVAGTFANRDHFANWICICLLFLLGWVLRSFWPLQSFRSTRVRRRPWTGLVVLAVLVAGLIAAISSGSRGAFLGLVAGIVCWSFLLATQTRSQKRMAALVLVGVAGLFVLLLSGDLLLKRLAETGSSFAVKISLWRDAFKLWPRYWLFGIGVGAFESVYPIAKSLFSGIVVLHPENEVVEQLLETGIMGCAMLLACMALFARHFACLFKRRDEVSDSFPASSGSKKGKRECEQPELLFGAIAAFAGFVCHGLFDFVFHIPANALLAGVFFGVVAGLADEPQKPINPAPPSPWRIPLHFFGATVLLLVAACQGLALFHWHKAERSAAFPIRRLRETALAVHLWPFVSHRMIALVRTDLLATQNQSPDIQSAEALQIDRKLAGAIRLDELNWELRLEKCLMDIQFSTNRAETYREALLAIQLNPRQPALPLQLATGFGRRYPTEALTILREAKFASIERIQDALAIAWRIEPETELLWSLTPNTTAGLSALGGFAAKHNLLPLATQAYLALKGRVKNVILAEVFLDLDRPDLALSLLSTPPANRQEKLIAARAYFKTRDFLPSLRYSEAILGEAEEIANVTRLPPTRSPIPTENPSNQADAERLAASLCALDSESEIDRIRELGRLYPKSKPIRWFIFQSERNARHFEAAAITGLELAQDVVNAR